MGIFWRPGHPKSGSRGAAEGAAGGISLTILGDMSAGESSG